MLRVLQRQNARGALTAAASPPSGNGADCVSSQVKSNFIYAAQLSQISNLPRGALHRVPFVLKLSDRV